MRKIIICGLDECGRGAWAGPLVAAGVVLSKSANQLTNKLKDSKKLNERQRKNIYKLILKHAKVVEVEIISTLQINNQGIGWANKEIFRRLIRKIEAHKYIVDGNLKFGRIKNKKDKVKSMIKADSIIAEVMAASIVAKVTRDKLMHELHMKYPRYGWISNVGYGTKVHLKAISEQGICRFHRGVFVTTALKTVEFT